MTKKALIPGSLSAIAQRNGIGIAESFLSADVILLVDMSGSMASEDAPGGISRFEAAERELRTLQERFPGKVAVVAFSDIVQFCPSGIPPHLGAGTNLTHALKFLKVTDGTAKIVIISDGVPNNPPGALQVAATFESKIDCIYIGPEGKGNGRRFLQRLAAQSGGIFAESDAPGLLAENVSLLLLA